MLWTRVMMLKRSLHVKRWCLGSWTQACVPELQEHLVSFKRWLSVHKCTLDHCVSGQQQLRGWICWISDSTRMVKCYWTHLTLCILNDTSGGNTSIETAPMTSAEKSTHCKMHFCFALFPSAFWVNTVSNKSFICYN